MTDAVRGKALGAGEAEARLRWTSVPRWPASPLPAAASYLACWFGPAGQRRAQALLAAAAPGVPVRTASFGGHWDPAAAAEMRRLLAGCFAGVRIIVAGPESVVLRAAALARQLGATSEELVLIAVEAGPVTAGAGAAEGAEGDGAGPACVDAAYVDGPAGRRVFCAACRRPFDAVAALGDVVTCPGCAAALIVDHRFSPARAAYFGWPSGLDLHR